MKKLILLAMLCAGLLTAAVFLLHQPKKQIQRGEFYVALNEIRQLAEMGDSAAASAKTMELEQKMRAEVIVTEDSRIPLIYGISMLFLISVTAYGCIAVVRPFEKLSRFADEIAKGNFDLPLNYE